METKDQSQAVAELFNMGLGFLKPMILNCAVELGIIHAISNHGEPITLTQLHSALSLPDSKKPYLFHLLRTLNYFHFVHVQGGVSVDYDEATYDLTPVSRLMTSKEGINLFPFVRLTVEGIEPCMLKASLSMGDWFKQDGERVPFELAHNCSVWQMASRNPKLNGIINGAMESTGTIFSDAVIKNGADLFKGVECLVDVAGGSGGVAKVIAANFPHVHCTVLDLPHVVQDLPKDGVVKFIGGDMFDYIPPADAILLKWVLHCLGDDDCVKVLRLCKDAVSSKGSGGGKVVIIEAVVGSSPGTPSEETQLLYDMVMLTMHASAERDEDEWKSLFDRAGFSSYKIVTTIGFMSIMEVYP